MSEPQESQEGYVEQPANGDFFFDDFFAEDEGIEVSIKIRGREVPLTVKPGVSVSERDAAVSRSYIREMDDKGRISIKGIDQKRLNAELMATAILNWPFKQRDGKRVPITADNCARLLVEGADQILLILKEGREAKLEMLDPFAVN
jgi:hypothetical protein